MSWLASLPYMAMLSFALQFGRITLKISLILLLCHYLYYRFIWKRFFSRSPRPYDQYLKSRAQTPTTPLVVQKKLILKTSTGTEPNGNESLEAFLTSVRLFGYLEGSTIAQIAGSADVFHVNAGDGLPKDSHVSHVYVLRRGRFRICGSEGCHAGVIARSPGDFLSSLLEIIGVVAGTCQTELFHRRVVALEDSEIIGIPVEVIKEMSIARPMEAYNCVRIVLTRFQRIICSSLFSHFGLTNELFRIDQSLSKAEIGRTPVASGDAKIILVDSLLSQLGIVEEEWDRYSKSIDMDSAMELIHLEEGESLGVDGFFLVVSGKASVALPGGQDSKVYGPRSLICSTNIVFGGKPTCTLTAEDACTLMHFNQHSLISFFEKNPKGYLSLAKAIVPVLTPLICFIDMNLEWYHVTAGLAICEAGSQADSLYIVIHGRLRSAVFDANDDQKSILMEIGPGQSYGEPELFQELPWPGTLFAVRDTELVRVPKDLFEILLTSNPSSAIRMAKLLATKLSMCGHTPMSVTPQIGMIKTITVIPSSESALGAAESLCKRLCGVISRTDACVILTKSAIITELGKHSFTAFGKLKLLEWLNRQEDMNRIVIYFPDSPSSPWTHRCVRQADFIFMVCDARDDPCLGEYEHQILSIPNAVRIELVLVHQNHHCPSGLTRRWLAPRPWIAQHHHIMLRLSEPTAKGKSNWRVPEMNWTILADQLMTQGFRRTLKSFYGAGNVDIDHSTRDIERLARRVLGRGIGLVLGGGGARGISQLGVIAVLEREGVPIDAIGGTSIGALVGGLYARDCNLFMSTALLRVFAALMSSKWRLAYDMTYPFCAWFTGESFNRALWKIFEERLIEDMWIPYFCITTDISASRMTVHREELAWRSIRASMSLSGFLPPLWSEGNSLLLDGGYTNNLPVDVMRSQHTYISRILAVDVSSERVDADEYYRDEVSGLSLLLRRLLGMRVNVPSLAEIQSRLAYVSCAERIKQVKELAEDPTSGIYYLRPPVQGFATLEFDKFERISRIGEQYATDLLSTWKQNGTIELLKPDSTMQGFDSHLDITQQFDGDYENFYESELSRRNSTVRRRRRSL